MRGKILSIKGKFKEATEVLQKYNTLNDSIATTDKELLILNQQVAYQTNELQQKIEEQEKLMMLKNQQEEEKYMAYFIDCINNFDVCNYCVWIFFIT